MYHFPLNTIARKPFLKFRFRYPNCIFICVSSLRNYAIHPPTNFLEWWMQMRMEVALYKISPFSSEAPSHYHFPKDLDEFVSSCAISSRILNQWTQAPLLILKISSEFMLSMQVTVSCFKPLIYQILLWTSSWPEFFDLFLKTKQGKNNKQQNHLSPLKKTRRNKTSKKPWNHKPWNQNSPVKY